MESLLFLSIAVMSCRVFLAEGFMISTGSMAPTLLGYHHEVVCPDCGYHFARGARYPEDVNWPSEAVAQDLVGDDARVASTICPNCLAAIDVSGLPVNEGDQLMVHKYAYDLRDPRRWEVVVFRNPADVTQPYVKRVTGLPGEVVEIEGGDIYADGRLQRKPLDVQRALRILVDDHDHQPHDEDPNIQPRWVAVEGEASSWSDDGGVISFAGENETDRGDAPDFDWLAFRHWIREGGRHETQVPLDAWPAGLSPAAHLPSNVSYDAERRVLISEGTLDWDDYQRIQARDDSPAWREAWDRLFAESHSPPVTDTYGYNHPGSANLGYQVRDMMVSCEVTRAAGDGIFILRLTDGTAIFDCEFDFGHGEMRLYANSLPDPLRVAPLPNDSFDGSALIEMSNFDRQVCVAVDGVELIAPVRYSTGDQSDEDDGEVSVADSAGNGTNASRHPVLIGAENLSLTVRHVQVFRDVYYTPKGRLPYRYDLDDDEFFVLGDNSPISSDSRAWDDPAVSRDLLIGKPLIVHLPSHQLSFDWGGETRYFRVPDLSRIRWIR